MLQMQTYFLFSIMLLSAWHCAASGQNQLSPRSKKRILRLEDALDNTPIASGNIARYCEFIRRLQNTHDSEEKENLIRAIDTALSSDIATLSPRERMQRRCTAQAADLKNAQEEKNKFTNAAIAELTPAAE
jgi:hypothetical protein